MSKSRPNKNPFDEFIEKELKLNNGDWVDELDQTRREVNFVQEVSKMDLANMFPGLFGKEDDKSITLMILSVSLVIKVRAKELGYDIEGDKLTLLGVYSALVVMAWLKGMEDELGD